MADTRFFPRSGPFTIAEILELTGASNASGGDTKRNVSDVAPLDRAEASDISFFDNVKYVETFASSRAGACFVKPRFLDRTPKSMVALATEDPYRCYALVAQKFYPRIAPKPGIHASAIIPASAKIGNDCRIEAGVVIGENAEVGEGTVIAANSVIGDGVVIGNFCQIGACSTISHCLVGNHVILHRGVHIGQDGFGFALGRGGHVKVPQLGRVIIEDHVEIGSGTCIDRGTGPDTHIGEGSKIDNLVQIGHNVQIGKQSVIVAQVGIAGSTRIGDGAVLGGQVGIAGHLKIGPGVKLAARSGVMEDIPAGAAYGGSPAVPVKDWHRQTLTLNKLIKQRGKTDE